MKLREFDASLNFFENPDVCNINEFKTFCKIDNWYKSDSELIVESIMAEVFERGNIGTFN